MTKEVRHDVALYPAEFSCVLTWLGNLWMGCAFPSAPVLHLTEQDHALGMYAGNLFDPRANPHDGPIWFKPWTAWTCASDILGNLSRTGEWRGGTT